MKLNFPDLRPARRAFASVLLGAALFSAIVPSLRGAPTAEQDYPTPQAAIAEGDKLSRTKQGQAYGKACAPALIEAGKKADEAARKYLKKTTTIGILILVGKDGRALGVLSAKLPAALAARKCFFGMVLPKPPRDRWPLLFNLTVIIR